MKKDLVCIVCPNGCEMSIETQGDEIKITGAQCKRGNEYVMREMTNPMRTIATSVLVENGEVPLVSVRVTKEIPKAQIFDVMDAIKAVRLKAPVSIGQTVISKVCGCNSDVIVTKNVEFRMNECDLKISR